MIATLFLVSCVIFAAAYATYGRFLERKLDISNERSTPAHELEDGMDYVPAPDPVLFGHHFSSIAGAGPIVGPIIAGLAFGWLPALLWILVGAILVGGVHDYTTLVASIRHRGETIGHICKQYLSPLAYFLFLIFIWFTLIYVLIVFLDLTAGTFAPAADTLVRQGGTVATAAILYILIALAFGLTVYRLKLRLGIASLIFVPLVFIALWVGSVIPLTSDYIPALMGSAKYTWSLLLLIYCFIASITPVWILLQPRDYLSSFLLYACLGGGAIGLLIGGFTGGVELQYGAFLGLHDQHLGFIFPALFITVACGAVSGFHSIVASGTTSKQLTRETSARRIGYGSMLVEGILGIVALATIMILTARPEGATPVAVFGNGIGTFLGSLGIPSGAASAFGLLAVSTFLLTTLDTCTRLARFVFQELTGLKHASGRAIATGATLLIPAVVVFWKITGPDGTVIPAWKAIWPAFGASNQLLASLALLVVFSWLRHERKTRWYVLAPMVFMYVTTLTALAQLVLQNLVRRGNVFVGWLSLALAIMAIVLLIDTYRTFKKEPVPATAVTG
jgi:carbon starvation protein